MPFITTCTIILSCLGLAPHKADSWWLGHVVPDDVVIADIAGQALDIFLHGPESAHKNGIVKTNIHSHIHSHPPIHTPETNKEQNPELTKHDAFVHFVPFLSNVVVGDGQEASQMFLMTAPRRNTPRTVQTENICRCVQHILQHFPTTMVFLKTSTITLSCLASAASQADSWWLGPVVTDDVAIADIAGQALDIFLHGPESAHKNGILNTFTHTSIPIHPCTLLKQGAEPSTHQTWRPHVVVLSLRNVVDGDNQEAWQMLLRTAPRRRPCRLGQCWQTFFSTVQNLRTRMAL